jgi:arginine-tRNA-protein transferase
MSHSVSIPERSRVFSLSNQCQYFADRTAVVDIALDAPPDLPGMPEDPAAALDDWLARGWRHFGSQFFFQRCPDCLACRSLRVPLADFRLSRSQRRVLGRNRDLGFEVISQAEFCHFWLDAALDLYNDYTRRRFGKPPARFTEFWSQFLDSPVDTRASLLLAGERLIGFGFLDAGLEAVSTIYFAFDPDEEKRSPGTFSILAEIAWARAAGFRYYHLGYWIPGHPDMDYKAAYRPHELLDLSSGRWLPTALAEEKRR